MLDALPQPASAPPRRAARPFDAASLILFERRRSVVRVLMGQRHAAHSFMPHRMVFPGGRLDRSDWSMRTFGALSAHAERRLLADAPGASPAKARALALCAIREMAEETGIHLGETAFGRPHPVPRAWASFAEAGVLPNLEALHFVARAITPPASPRRFDARFFAADVAAIGTRAEGVAGPASELVSVKWLTLEETRHENLADITRSILEELRHRLDTGLGRDLPVPFFRERHGRWRRDEV